MKTTINTILIATAIILTALILSNAFKNRNRHNDTIRVKGLAEKDFVSDLIVWSGSFTRKNMNLKDAYSELDKDRECINGYLLSKGIQQRNIIFYAVEINKEFDEVTDNSGKKVNAVFSGYRLKQNLQIESNEVDKVEDISRQVSELINKGVEFYSNPPEYYYTKLSKLKIEMIAEATKDANTRANKIAENSGSELGRLKGAEMGVFQIVAQNSAEGYSWGGSFNTASKRKTATITITQDYEIK